MQRNERMFFEFLRDHSVALLEVCRNLHLVSAASELEELLDAIDERLENDNDSPSPTMTNKEQSDAKRIPKTDVSPPQVGHDVAARGKLLDRP